FRIKWDNQYVPHVSLAGPLVRSVTTIDVRDGAAPNVVHAEPGRLTWPPVVLQRPITADTSFAQWANQIAGTGAPAAFRKEVTIEVYCSRGTLALLYHVHRCWPQSYEALPMLGTEPRRHILETLTLAHEGWERDVTVPFPGQ